MRDIYPWIYLDCKENLWKFSLNNNKELSYGIMYKEGKWTKEILIDTKVLGFAIYIDENEGIHLVYSNTKGELRYCTMKNKQWVGKTIYQLDNKDFEIENLKVEIIGSNMHIFYLLVGNDGSDHGVLMHCVWSGQETTINRLADIILISNLKEYYSINTNYKGDIYVFFLSDEGDEISLNYCTFENNRWIQSKRLYGIQGEDIGFEVVIDKHDIHILNKSREGLIYSLDHVYIDSIGNVKDFKIYEIKSNLLEPLLFIESNKLCSCWLENDKIFYSIFNKDKWEDPVYFDRGNNDTLGKYNAFICTDNDRYIKEKKVYGTDNLDMKIYDPSEFLITMKDSLRHDRSKYEGNSYSENELVESLKSELSKEKVENNNLVNRIAHLNLRLQKNQKFMEEYEQQIARTIEQKRKAEENCNVFLELQKKIQKDLENTNSQLLEMRESKEKLEESMKDYEDEIISLKNQLELANDKIYKLSFELKEINKKNQEEKDARLIVEDNLKGILKENASIMIEITLVKEENKKIISELVDKNKQLIEEKEYKLQIENQLKYLEEENLLIKEEARVITEENNRLKVELDLERNQSVMDRLLRRRASSNQNNF
ncbi:hypothetical protein [Clostridium sp. D46t1_190503_E9]|uniref:hypothetical protein n=1 Tax=Clostridium sp. D46t1_190503_E9 TaxID=2787137 RepID=UPI0018979354|nr:hypothetical protein [Clostridium sp. D46t1_190503_E9]